MNMTIKTTPADLIANWQNEARQFRAESDGAKARNAVINQEIADLALAVKQGDADAIAKVARLRAERAANLDLIELNEPAVRKLEALAASELSAEQARSDRHLRRKADKGIQTMPAGVKDLERGINLLVRGIVSLHATAEPLRTSWRSSWPAIPGILLEGVITRAVSHALYTAFRDAQIKPIEPRYSEDVAKFRGLHHYFSAKATDAKNRLLGEGDAVVLEDPTLDDESAPSPSNAPMPVKLQEQPHTWTDADLAENERLGNPAGLPTSGREYVKLRDYADKLNRVQIAEGVDFDPI